MDNLLFATWAVLVGGALFTLMVSTSFYATREPNQNGAVLATVLTSCSLLVVLGALENRLIIISVICSAYLLFSSLVLFRWRFHPLRTLRNTRKATIVIGLTWAALVLLTVYDAITSALVMSVSLATALYMFVKVRSILSRAKIRVINESSNLPSLSVATPARNETRALTKHLKSLVSSEYQKIEFLVLDDCSQDNTAEIIRSFASDGVRFIQGRAPTESWIGKNLAYQTLTEEASGDYIAFTGVDTRFEPKTLELLISYMRQEKLAMISVMPQNAPKQALSLVVQPMRYLFMLVSSTHKHPPLLSTTWIIKKSELLKNGGFGAVQNSIIPEVYFARQLKKAGKYRFVVAPKWLGLFSKKYPDAQAQTLIRTLYPILRKNPGVHMLFSMFFFSTFAYPGFLVAKAVFVGFTVESVLAVMTLGFLLLTYYSVLKVAFPKRAQIFAVWNFPLSVVAFYYLSVKSMVAYERDDVVWKGRNVCMPIMLRSVNYKN